ncbi:hypothetical protein acdb102_35050 [Acidothermaceae bacterium B102]|nr:hypothetical protein acdb102_35050 [Acidothermaceae bacterium B102]
MPAQSRHRTRFWVETAGASLTGALFVLTLFWHDWLEALGFDPDHHNGSAEWAIVAVLLAVSLSLAAAARWEWRHPVPATS